MCIIFRKVVSTCCKIWWQSTLKIIVTSPGARGLLPGVLKLLSHPCCPGMYITFRKVVCDMQHAQQNPIAEHPDSHCYNRGPARSHLVPVALLPRLFYCLSLCPGSVTCRCCLQEGSVTCRCCLQEGSVTCRCCLQEGGV